MDNKLVFSGAKLKEIRTSQHMAVEELAQSIGTDIRYLQRLESGKKTITISMAKRIALALDVYIDELL